MRRLSALALLCLSFFIRAADAPSNLYLLGFALNQHPEAGATIDQWNFCAEEMDKVLHEQAVHVKVQSKIILGAKATRAAVMDGFKWLHANATKNDLVFLYVGCHGGTDPEEGWNVESADKKTIWGHEVKAELGKLPCQVFVMISSCTSGGFASPHKSDPPVPANVTAFCACTSKQETGNQIDISVCEGLCGRADFNHDGVVDVDELIRYVKLRYKEWWPDPKTMDGIQTPVIIKSKELPGTLPLTRVNRNLVEFAQDGNWYAALKQRQLNDKFQVFLLGYSNKPGPDFVTGEVTREFICEDGRPMTVEQGGRWYPARLLRMEGPNFHVHYLGFNEQETVPKSRVFFPFVGDPEHPNYPYFVTGNAGGWTRIGSPGAWKNTHAGAILNGKLYTVETNGAFYVTDLSDGEWKQIGNPDYASTKWMFATGDSLFTIEKDGSLYKLNPKDGARTRLGAEKGWAATISGTLFNGKLYTIEASGDLYVTNLNDGSWLKIGQSEFANTAFIFSAAPNLYTIEKDGNLYRVNPNDGRWVGVGEANAWKQTQAGTAFKGRIYTVESSGCLFSTDVTNGTWRQYGKAEFGGTKFIFGGNERLYTIEKDGSLYSVSIVEGKNK
ncbi:MAG TPA: hypothetical protein VKX17_15360 [Planctomycetota bacterium]|nr:hypothetical protein [Planctomycetota bacterium]